jgi:putative ABC transport system permease protein
VGCLRRIDAVRDESVVTTLFGVSMTTIMVILLALCAGCLAAIAWIAVRSRILFRIGVRNIPRRRAQSALIVVGLMLSTLIVSAAFTTGDTLAYSVTHTAYDLYGPLDLTLNLRGAGRGESVAPFTDQRFVPTLAAHLANDPQIAALLPAARFQVPVVDERTHLGTTNALLMGDDPAAVDRVGALVTPGGQHVRLAALPAGDVFINDTLRSTLNARPGDVLAIYGDATSPITLRVATVVHATLLAGASGTFAPGAVDPGGMVLPLAAAQQIGGYTGEINFLGFSLRGGGQRSQRAAAAARQRIQQVLQTDPDLAALPFVTARTATTAAGSGAFAGGGRGLVQADKADAVNLAATVGSVATSVFVILGLFSIAAGMLLIILIFVMLAAERMSEMGMLRAIGVRRAGLVQAYLAEGTVYDVLAGMVGAGLGVAIAFAGVVGGARLVVGSGAPVFAHVTWRSVIVAYCLGLALTFVTVLIAAYRVSRLNITVAIRDLPDGAYAGRERFARRGPVRMALGTALTLAALALLALASGHRSSVTPLVALGVPAGVLGLLLLVRGLGGPWLLVHAAVGLLIGGVLIVGGRRSGDPFPVQLGVSLAILGAAQLARYSGRSPRLVYSIAGAALFTFWALPQSASLGGATPLALGGTELFFVSGIMMVTGSTLLLVYNADLLTSMFALEREGVARYLRAGAGLWIALLLVAASLLLHRIIGDTAQLLYLLAALFAGVGVFGLIGARFSRVVPALKLAIAYPMANRFRTGMTVGMFSLIVFSLTLISTLDANFAAIFAAPDARGGWDIRGGTVQDKPIADVRAALRQSGAQAVASELAAVGRAGHPLQNATRTQVRQAGTSDQRWRRYDVLPVDSEYLQRTTLKLQAIASGYRDQQAVWDAVVSTPGLAVISASAIPTGGIGDPNEFRLHGVGPRQARFAPVSVELRDTRTGTVGRVQVIGIVDRGISEQAFSGMVVTQGTFEQTFGPASLDRYFIRLAPGANAQTVAKQLRSVLLTQGFQADAMSDVLGGQQQLQEGVTYLLQGFMGLGLLVGVAALGVIAFRSVVERRQAIGMLRALGFRRSTVALSFLAESTFIAILGSLAGVVGATLLARNIFHGGIFPVAGASFFIPWQQVLVFVAAGYGCSLVMAFLPARGAARIPAAEALRYE